MEYNYENYLSLGICPDIVDGELRFSQKNIDYIIDKYLKIIKDFDRYKERQLAMEREFDNQIMMARADTEYYKSKYKQCSDELKELKLLDKRYDRFEERNAGLRGECKKYKQSIKELKEENLKLKQMTQQIVEEIKEYCNSKSRYDINECSNKMGLIDEMSNRVLGVKNEES